MKQIKLTFLEDENPTLINLNLEKILSMYVLQIKIVQYLFNPLYSKGKKL